MDKYGRTKKKLKQESDPFLYHKYANCDFIFTFFYKFKRLSKQLQQRCSQMQSFLERVGLGKMWNTSSERAEFGHEINHRGKMNTSVSNLVRSRNSEGSSGFSE